MYGNFFNDLFMILDVFLWNSTNQPHAAECLCSRALNIKSVLIT